MKAMTGREKQKIVAILEIVNNAMKCHQDKTAEDDRRMSYFVGQRDALEGMLRLIQTGNAAGLTVWCDTRQKIMIDDILSGKVKL